MREILFRAKRRRADEWVESESLNQFKNPYTEKVEAHLWRDGHGWMVCDIETVGQFTGLIDRNGKRIFEGDVVRHYKRGIPMLYLYEVTFENGAFGVCRLGDKTDALGFCEFYKSEFEVIGNVHDNSELSESMLTEKI